MKKMTKAKLQKAIKNSFSIAGVLKFLEMSISTGNYRSFHKYVKQYNLNTKHFLGQSHLQGKIRNIKTTIPLEKILIENSNYLCISSLKQRLIRLKLLIYNCYMCGIATWKNNFLSLQLDHINGIHNDHRLENLRLLCPNCHSQTETFCGKNKEKIKYFCKCGKEIWKTSKSCRSCSKKSK